MKKILMAAFVLLCCSSLLLSGDKYDLNVIMIGIGAKNPTFTETQFPHIQFYYTPGLISQAETGETGKSALSMFGKAAREVFKGEPKMLEQWWDETDLRDHAILFDKNGVGAWEGSVARDDDDLMACKGKGDESKLEDALETFVKDKDEADFDKGKKFDPEEADALLEMKMGDFEVVAPAGNTVPVKSLFVNGKPTLVVFFQISSGVNLKEAKESGEGKSSGSFLGAMTKGAAGSKWSARMISLESQLFGYDAREK
jgi:hypothetical protein